MTDTPIATLNTGTDHNAGATPPPGTGGHHDRQPPRDGLPLLGIFAVGFGVISIFVFAFLFVPLALILGVIALFTRQVGWGVSAILLAVIGTLTSPMLLMMLGLGALLSYFGMPMMGM